MRKRCFRPIPCTPLLGSVGRFGWLASPFRAYQRVAGDLRAARRGHGASTQLHVLAPHELSLQVSVASFVLPWEMVAQS